MEMIVDVYTHMYPKEYLRLLESSSGAHSSKRTEDGWHIHYWGFNIPFLEDSVWTSPERRMKVMDKYKVDMQVLTLGAPALNRSGQDATALAKASNDAIAKISEKHPDRFVGVAEVPLNDLDEGLEEFDRTIKELGLKGIQLQTTIEGRSIASPEFLPLFERASKYGVPVWLHPCPREATHWIYSAYRLDYIFCWPLETSITMGELVMNGIMEKCAKLKVVTHHLGAMFPFFMERFSNLIQQRWMKGVLGIKLKKTPAEYVRLFYHDTALYGSKPGLECAYQVFDHEKICFGTDYMYGPEEGERFLRATLESIREARIPQEDKERILGGNAAKLLNL